MSRLSLILTIICCVCIQTIALADYTVTTVQPIQSSCYSDYQNYPHPYYNNGQNINQNDYINQYSAQYPNQYQAPYSNIYQNPYNYGSGYMSPTAQIPYSIVNSGLSGVAGSGIKNQILRNVGRNVLYSMMRGY